MHQYASIRTADDWDDYLDTVERPARSPRKATATKSGRAEDVSHLPSGHSPDEFSPSFTGSRHERGWILTYLSPFYRDQQIVDVLRVVKGGKEATVYCCAAHESTGLELIAAKVYRPKTLRTFKNDADYKWGRPLVDAEGKAMRDKRILKAVLQGSRVGEAVSHTSWLAHEFATMTILHGHGADVPRPLAHADNAILMEYFGDRHSPAPTLSETRIEGVEAQPMFQRLLWNVELMLSHDRIHGDLSAYNVLYWDGRAVIIDFPQVIDAYGNPNAYRFLHRDVERLCQYFSRYGVRADPERIARGMWHRVMTDETYQIRGSRW